MKKNVFIIVMLTLITCISSVFAQQCPIYDQYHFDYYLINPAIAGADRNSHILGTGKIGMAGKDGPNTFMLSFRTRLKSKNIGLGGYIYNDNTPNFNYIGGQFTFAYHIPMSIGARYRKFVELDRQLSFGLSARIKYLSYTSHGMEAFDPADLGEGEVIPDVNFGIYYQSYGWFAGFSMTNMIPFKPRILNDLYIQEELTMMLFGGYAAGIAEGKTIEPSINYHADIVGNHQLEINLKYTQNNEISKAGFWAQLSYRHNFWDTKANQTMVLIPMIGARFGKFQLGYAFNLHLNELASTTAGTHEFVLGYSFYTPKRFCR